MFSPREANPGTFLRTSRKRLNYSYQRICVCFACRMRKKLGDCVWQSVAVISISLYDCLKIIGFVQICLNGSQQGQVILKIHKTLGQRGQFRQHQPKGHDKNFLHLMNKWWGFKSHLHTILYSLDYYKTKKNQKQHFTDFILWCTTTPPLEFQVHERTPRFKVFTQALNPSGCTAPPIVFNVPCDGHRSLESCHTWKAYHWSQIVCTLCTSQLGFTLVKMDSNTTFNLADFQPF